MINRRQMLKFSGAATLGSLLPVSFTHALPVATKGPFYYCLNTSTISGQRVGLLNYIEIASKAGYDGIELWVADVKDYLAKGNSIQTLAAFIQSKNITVYDAISFTTWLVDDEAERNAGIAELEEEMKLMSVLGCHRIAAPPAGLSAGTPVNFELAGKRYHDILELGRKYNVMPLLEFWGASQTLYNFSQALAIAAAADDADARILPDVYHMFRGGSGFNCLQLVNGKVIDIIHMNDYPGNKPVGEQNDSDRIYPGDGVAPLKQILQYLKAMGGNKVLSLELFNATYWKEDALVVATTGLQKMKLLVKSLHN
jgi:2-keto-myo-inositol isomerase